MKKALCIGINYEGTDFALRGCVNDADDWARLLMGHGFDVGLLAERQGTKANVVQGIGLLVAALQPGDVGFVTFSGHGTWVPDKSGDEADGRDEALVTADAGEDGVNLLVDDELAALFSGVPAGAHLVFVSDCCHSGTAFRMMPGGGRRKARFLPPSHFVRSAGLAARVDRAYATPVRAAPPLPGVVHFSGCKDTEYSYDAEYDDRPCGAFTYNATRAMAAAAAGGLTYADAHREVRRHLPCMEYPQTPLFNAPPALRRTVVFGGPAK